MQLTIRLIFVINSLITDGKFYLELNPQIIIYTALSVSRFYASLIISFSFFRAHRPCKLTACGYVDVNMNAFAKVLLR